MLNQEADLIRNGVLQDIFAIRRRLELLSQTRPLARDSFDRYLPELKHVYTILENLSNRLESPYLQNSLPLALEHSLKLWSETMQLEMQLPQTWEPDPIEYSRLLILLIENLWKQLAIAVVLPHHCTLILQHQAAIKELRVQVSYKELLPSSLSNQIAISLIPFLKTFQLLTQGQYEQDFQPRSLNWILRWQTLVHADS